jgi:hypothetical protein
MRGIAEARAADLTGPGGRRLARSHALTRAADLGTFSAVPSPAEGTVLTVARAAADRRQASLRSPGTTCSRRGHQGGGRRRTRPPWPHDRRARGPAPGGCGGRRGRGLVVLSDALLEVVTGVHSDLPEFARLARAGLLADPQHMLHGYGGPAYEVMYLLDADDEAMPALRSRPAGRARRLARGRGRGRPVERPRARRRRRRGRRGRPGHRAARTASGSPTWPRSSTPGPSPPAGGWWSPSPTGRVSPTCSRPVG